MPELLLELFSEEIPARMQLRAAEDLKRLVTDKLKGAGLSFASAEAFVTPRRLALVVDGLPLKQSDQNLEKKGPRVGAPENAVHGFLKSAGLSSLDQCEKRKIGNADYWYAVFIASGKATARVLVDLIGDAITPFPWPKSMRWTNTTQTWVRPLHNILAVFDGAPLVLEYDLRHALDVNDRLSLVANNRTQGHRFMAPGEIAVSSFADYKAKLRERFVIIDQNERREIIRKGVEDAATREGLKVKDDPALLDEVTGLVEWPVPLVGTIDAEYMSLPPEVLATTMRANQKYFALLKPDGALAPKFIVIANRETTDRGVAVVHGNERVLRARLSDAKFFWDQDRKVKLEERVPALASRVFHAKLGTMADKVQRLETLAAELVPFIPGADVDRVRSAALLCKADLSSGMVGEFPELQGIMGRYYALQEGEKPDVADAIRDHYSPLGPNDRCPTAPVSVAVALADKIDSLVGFFMIGEAPTGSRDPFALRRTGLGIIRLILENTLRIPLRVPIGLSFSHYEKRSVDYSQTVWFAGEKFRTIGSDRLTNPDQFQPKDMFAHVLTSFFTDRLKVALREKGVRHDLIDAVFSLGGEDDLVRLLARVDALGAFLKTEDGANLLVAYRRASNIVTIEQKIDKISYDAAVDVRKLMAPEEKTLHAALEAAVRDVRPAIGRDDFVAAMQIMARLRSPVDRFFDKVTVNTSEKELRANRLHLLSEIRRALHQVADFSKIEG